MIHKMLQDENKTSRSLIEEKLRSAKKTNSICLAHFSLKTIPPEVSLIFSSQTSLILF